eukprot:UN30330
MGAIYFFNSVLADLQLKNIFTLRPNYMVRPPESTVGSGSWYKSITSWFSSGSNANKNGLDMSIFTTLLFGYHPCAVEGNQCLNINFNPTVHIFQGKKCQLHGKMKSGVFV